MKFASFTRDGVASYGLVAGGGLVDFGAAVGAPADLKTAIASGALPELAKAGGPTLALDQIALLPVIPNPAKILCVGHNYETHRVETGRAKLGFPSIFTRFADTLTGADTPIAMPSVSTNLDFEAELAVVIGHGGRNIAEADAMAHVVGVACFNDASVRDWQWHTSQFTPGKNFPTTGPFGPYLVTIDELGDLNGLAIISRLNGEVMQSAYLGDMIFSIPKVIAYISQFTALSPGDVIATGTPGGVGAKRVPPVWMKPGDVIEVEISRVGLLRNTIA